ncbi:MAG: MFS transporter [Thermoleophilaceae bacterium]
MNTSPMPAPIPDRRRWIALVVLCLAQFMITLDTTVVNVALPAIQRDLHFSETGLTWIVNAFLVTFGSFLLLAGRLGDLFGRRRVLLIGVGVFTTASVLCGIAPNQGLLIAARLAQGVGAAMQAAVILAIIATEFTEVTERARAMSAYVFVSVSGAALGLLAGAVLTESLSWHWIFLINLPIGLATIILARALIPADRGLGREHGVDWLGSTLVTASVMTAVYAIVQASTYGWGSSEVLGFAALAAALMGAFLTVEARIENPMIPLRVLWLPGLIGSSFVRGLLGTALYTTFFLGTLYFEHVLHYTAVQTGLAFLPWFVTLGILSVGVTARLVERFGPMPVLVAGLGAVVAGLALFASAGVHANFFPTIMVANFAVGAGIGAAMIPLLTIAMADVPAEDRGLGSAITTVFQQVGGALGLAVLSTIATNHSRSLQTQGDSVAGSLVSGYHLAFVLSAATIGVAIVTALIVLRPRPVGLEAESEPAPELEPQAA